MSDPEIPLTRSRYSDSISEAPVDGLLRAWDNAWVLTEPSRVCLRWLLLQNMLLSADLVLPRGRVMQYPSPPIYGDDADAAAPAF